MGRLCPKAQSLTLSNTILTHHVFVLKNEKCEEFKFRGWYDVAFRLDQETHQILFEFQQTR